jgi:hypothetical protein
VKGISSDQFFGRDEEDAAKARNRLEKYSGSTAISSDMLNSNSNNDYQSNTSSDSNWSSLRTNYNNNNSGGGMSNVSPSDAVNASLDRLKVSVSGFFEDIQKRIG